MNSLLDRTNGGRFLFRLPLIGLFVDWIFKVPITEVQTAATINAGVVNLTTNYHKTIIPVTCNAATPTINVTNADPEKGDELILLLNNDATARVVTFGTGFTSQGTLAGTINTTSIAYFIWTGSAFQEISRNIHG